jgi:hypothetical protein
MIWAFLAFVAFGMVSGSVTTYAQDLPRATEQYGAFAFSNEEGSRLLSTADMARPESLRTALCSGGKRVAVRFERRQVEGNDSIGRQNPLNFAKTAGSVFRVEGANVESGTTCFLAAEPLIAGATIIELNSAPENARCSRNLYPSFQSAKSRPVVSCWPIAHSASGVQVLLIEFARRLRYALASLVVIDRDTRMYVDYPAEFSGPGADLWRVDDGGEIGPEVFKVVSLLKWGSTYVLAVRWDGTEGAALSLWSTENDDQFKQLLNDSWYLAPI